MTILAGYSHSHLTSLVKEMKKVEEIRTKEDYNPKN